MPVSDEVKAVWSELNRVAMQCGGMVITIPNKFPATLLSWPRSQLPNDLLALGYRVKRNGDREWLDPLAATEVMTQTVGKEERTLRVLQNAGHVTREQFEVLPPTATPQTKTWTELPPPDRFRRMGRG